MKYVCSVIKLRHNPQLSAYYSTHLNLLFAVWIVYPIE